MTSSTEAILKAVKEIRERAEKATPAPWVWGEWTIYDSDREAQKRREPYWTLKESVSQNLCQGPFGRKSLDTESVASGDGHDESSITVNTYDANFIAKAREDIPRLLSALEICVEALDKIKSGSGRAEILGAELYRCPSCASAEIANEALSKAAEIIIK